MNHHRTDRTISSIIGHLEALTIELPNARNALLDTRNQIDGYPSGTDAPRVTSTSELTPTESAANQRQHIDTQLQGLNDELNAIALTVKNLRADCQRYIATVSITPDKPHCRATGREGYMQPRNEGGWSDLNCQEIPARGPLCLKCYHRERRWRIAHGLPTREDTAA